MSGGILHLARIGLDRIQHMPEQAKIVGDGVSIGTLLGSIFGGLPHIATLVTIIWGCIRIYETKTVQDWLAKRRKKGPEPPA